MNESSILSTFREVRRPIWEITLSDLEISFWKKFCRSNIRIFVIKDRFWQTWRNAPSFRPQLPRHVPWDYNSTGKFVSQLKSWASTPFCQTQEERILEIPSSTTTPGCVYPWTVRLLPGRSTILWQEYALQKNTSPTIAEFVKPIKPWYNHLSTILWMLRKKAHERNFWPPTTFWYIYHKYRAV